MADLVGEAASYYITQTSLRFFLPAVNYEKNNPRLPQSEAFRKRRALAITETELKLMAALASMGLRSQPTSG